MKKYLVLLLTLLVSTFSLNSFAFTAPPKPADNTYVLDQTGKLSGDQVSKLNAKIEALNKSTKNEYAIVLLKTLDGAAIEDAAQDTFRTWGVGKANLNNGVMIMVALAERKTRIQTGKNAEGDLPDLLCKDILDRTLKPLLKKGDFYGGFDATLDSVVSHMESREKEKAVVAAPKEVANAAPADVTAASQNSSSSNVGGILLVLLLGGAGVVGLIAFFSYRSNKRLQEEEESAEFLRQERRAVLDMKMEKIRRNLEQNHRPIDKVRTAGVVLPVPSHEPPKADSHTARNVAVGTAALGAAALAVAAVASKRDEDAAKRQREESARRRREEEDAARRRREADEAASRRRSEESSSSSWSSSSSSSSSSWDSGGSSGFGGGDSGGGGGSSDF